MNGLDHIKSWEKPMHSYVACAFMIALAFQTSLAAAGSFLWLIEGELSKRGRCSYGCSESVCTAATSEPLTLASGTLEGKNSALLILDPLFDHLSFLCP